MRTLAKGLACNFGEELTHYSSSNITSTNITSTNITSTYTLKYTTQLDRLPAVKSEPIECFEGYHNLVVVFAMIGMSCLYPTAMLTRPMFQALDQNLKITFDYTYLFVFAQIQTVLLVASAFFPSETKLLLGLCLISDLVLVGYFWFKKPCTAPLLNTIALIAFGFSAWLNIASLIVVVVGDDSLPSIMMFFYVVCVLFLLIYGLQVVYFPLDDYKHLSKLEGPEKMQLAISMRTEVAIRLLNLLTDAEFWTDIVVATQPEEWKDWTVGGILCSSVFFLNCAHAACSTFYFGGLRILAWYVDDGRSTSWHSCFMGMIACVPAKYMGMIACVGKLLGCSSKGPNNTGGGAVPGAGTEMLAAMGVSQVAGNPDSDIAGLETVVTINPAAFADPPAEANTSLNWMQKRRNAARKWLKDQAAAAAGVRLAKFILRSTVAMVVFDVMDILITMLYDDETEGPPTKTAILSALFSAASATYGLVGRKRDLKVRGARASELHYVLAQLCTKCAVLVMFKNRPWRKQQRGLVETTQQLARL
jgi:hypothetical protein